MARFLVTYHGSEMSHDPEEMAKAREVFMQWAEKTGAPLVEPGAPVQSTTTVSGEGCATAGQMDRSTAGR